jgi:hypothetical protein
MSVRRCYIELHTLNSILGLVPLALVDFMLSISSGGIKYVISQKKTSGADSEGTVKEMEQR